MKRLISVVAVAAIIVAGTASAGDAATRPCVSNDEYRQVRVGMTLQRVTRIFDGMTGGIWRSGPHSHSRQYRRCGMPSWATAGVNFSYGRVKYKYLATG